MSPVSPSWFEADAEGLRKLVEGRPKVTLLRELIQNALDENSTRVDLTLEPVERRPLAQLIVEDDNPGGFADLSHAYTLFAESGKKADPTKRGRFNLGEKLVLSCFTEARVVSTSGSVEFRSDGTRRRRRTPRTSEGSRLEGLVRMTRAELGEALDDIHLLLPPADAEVWVNGERIPVRTPVLEFEVSLPTVIADEEGVLRRTRRKTHLEIFRPIEGEVATLFELGIPVVETGDEFHVNVQQKVPLNSDRDNVTPGFLREVRTAVLNASATLLDGDALSRPWVGDALRSSNVTEDVVRTVVRERFGENVVAADPSDPEAMNKAASCGFTVLAGGTLDKDQWENVRRAGAAPPAGRVFPTPKPYSDDPDAPPVEVVSEKEWTPAMAAVVDLARRLARHLMGVELRVRIVRTSNDFGACYGEHGMDLNLRRLGAGFFDDWRTPEGLRRILDLFLDEFAHEYESNHLSENYYKALRMLGAKMTVLALRSPEELWPAASPK